MATKTFMQARSSSDNALYTWLTEAPDWGGASYAGPGTPLDVAISCVGGLATFVTGANQVTVGGVDVTAGGVAVTVTLPAITVSGVQVTAGGIDVIA